MINKLIGILTFISGLIFIAYRKGGKDLEAKQTKKRLKSVNKSKKIKEVNRNLSDDKLNAKLRKYARK